MKFVYFSSFALSCWLVKKLTNYLNLIYKVWSKIASDDLTIMRLIDEITIKCLELRALNNSNENVRIVSARVDDESIFDAIIDLSMRRSFLINILKQQQLISFLHIFCENIKYFEFYVNAIKRLLESSLKDIVRSIMRIFFDQSLREYANDYFEHRYKQLWAFAHRHFSKLMNVAFRKELNQNKLIIKKSNLITWYRFAQFALDLSFISNSLLRLKFKKKLENSFRDFKMFITKHILNRKLIEQLIR